MRWSLETIKDVASTVQSIAIAIAVVIGGFWALYVFITLAQTEKAELDVKMVSLEKAKQEQELQPRAIVELKLSISQPEWFGRARPLVQIAITAKNMGNRLEMLRLPLEPVKVYALLAESNGELSLRLLPHLPKLESPGRSDFYSISPTEHGAFPLTLISMPSSGVYLFKACVPLERTAELETSKRATSTDLWVCDEQFFHVK